MKIFIVGSGKLANAISSSDLLHQSLEVVKWESVHQNLNEKAIIIHAGSGRQVKECLEFCDKTKSVFIELSTGLETEHYHPKFPLIICPNTSILMLKTMSIINSLGSYFENYTISIIESHQSTKITEPGTAFSLANSLKLPVDKIVSIRNPEIQHHVLGIPSEFLSKHAYHKIIIKDRNDEVTIETKVLGHDSYANGVKEIIDIIIKQHLENRRYTVLELIQKP
jgi:4-hydroxy-tetrahydrodipicolinate reductase